MAKLQCQYANERMNDEITRREFRFLFCKKLCFLETKRVSKQQQQQQQQSWKLKLGLVLTHTHTHTNKQKKYTNTHK